jgi:protein SCO1/2
MLKHPEKLAWLVLGGVFVLISVMFFKSRPQGPPLPVFGQVTPFHLTNQNGVAVSSIDLANQIWVSDVIFSRCPLQCLLLSKKMKLLQDKLAGESGVKFVSLTTDPGYDSPKIFNEYAKRFQADSNRWLFLTGPLADLRRLQISELKFVVKDNPADLQTSANDLFVHSTNFILVDGKGRARATFDTEEADFQERIVNAIRQLKREK